MKEPKTKTTAPEPEISTAAVGVQNVERLSLELQAAKAGPPLGLASEQQIEAWKQKHGTIHQLLVPLNDEGSEFGVAYLRPVTITAMSRVFLLPENDYPAKAQILLEDLWLGGYEPIKTRDELVLASMVPVMQIMSYRQAAIKKL